MIEKAVETRSREVFVIKDDITGETHEFELEADATEATSKDLLDQNTAQKLIAQEQAQLQTHTYNRRRAWGVSALAGAAFGSMQVAAGFIYDTDEYSVGIILGGGGILAGAVATIGVATCEFVNHINKRTLPITNDLIHERIDVLQSHTDWS